MENQEFIKELKFGPGDGNLHYYLFNWRCPDMTHDRVAVVLQWFLHGNTVLFFLENVINFFIAFFLKILCFRAFCSSFSNQNIHKQNKLVSCVYYSFPDSCYEKRNDVNPNSQIKKVKICFNGLRMRRIDGWWEQRSAHKNKFFKACHSTKFPRFWLLFCNLCISSSPLNCC